MAMALSHCQRKLMIPVDSQDRRLVSPKLKIVGTSVMMSLSNPGAGGTGGTSNDSSKCVSGVATATAILQ